MLDTTNNTIHTSNAVVYRKQRDMIKYFLVQENDSSWGFPGGAKDYEDEDFLATLRRELQEELGLFEDAYLVSETDIVYEFEYGDKSVSRKNMIGTEHIFLVELLKDFKPNLPDDLLQYGWFTKDEAVQKLSEIAFFSYRADLFKRVVNFL